eukprot:jgi/Mesen1/2311/ME000155S01395
MAKSSLGGCLWLLLLVAATISCQVEARPQGVRHVSQKGTPVFKKAAKVHQVVKPRHKRKEKNGTLVWVEAGASSGDGALDPPVYNGGPVMSAPVKVYLIWYGDWSQPGLADATTQAVVRAFLRSFNVPRSSYPASVPSVASWHAINLQYYGQGGTTVSASVALAGETSDWYSQGGANGGYILTDGDVANVVWAALGSQGGPLPDDTDGIYFVLTSSDVQVKGFCADNCGWHTFMDVGGGRAIKYAFVGNAATQCLNGCASQFYGGAHAPPNDDAAADAMVSVLAHELAEAVTDPLIDAWYRGSYTENADICAWSWGNVLQTSTGGRYAAATRVNVGAYVALYTKNGYKGSQLVTEAPVPGGGCLTLTSRNRPLNSLKFRWNVKDGKPNHVGCGRFVIWDEINCYGK